MPAMAGAILRREHLVAACLVGTVVVVVGFASGLGITNPAGVGPQAGQNTAMPPMSPSTDPDSSGAGGGANGSGGGSGGVNYVGTPGGLAVAPIGSSPGIGDTVVPTSAGSPPGTTTEPSPTGTPTTTTAPPATCEPGLLNALLDQAGSAVNGVPVLGPLVPPLTGALVGNCPAQSTMDQTAPSTTQAAVPGLLPLLALTPTGTGS